MYRLIQKLAFCIIKVVSIIILISTLSIEAMASDTLSLVECQQLANQNLTYLDQKELLEQIKDYELKNLLNNYFPSVSFNAKASYQSDVTSISLDLPLATDIPRPSKDQYSTYIELSQLIYDGGLTRSLKELQQAQTQLKVKALEAEQLELEERINTIYLSIIKLKNSEQILLLTENELEERISILNKGIETGSVLPFERNNLQAELYKLRQNRLILKQNYLSLTDILSVLINKELSADTEFTIPGIPNNESNKTRTEIELLHLKNAALDARIKTIKAQRQPKLAGFGQAGYGKPGLNMLSDEFADYWIIGARLSVPVFDWKETQNKKNIAKLNQQLNIENINKFEINMNASKAAQLRKIAELNELLELDDKIIAIKDENLKTSSSMLDNGEITSVEYLNHLNSYQQAQLNRDVHTIELIESKLKLLYIQGYSLIK